MLTKTLGVLFLTGLTGLAAADADFETIKSRRKDDLASAVTGQFQEVPTFLSGQSADGTWGDVNYATGCDAPNWPAQVHWNRILVMASAWSGLGSEEYKGRQDLLDAAKKGMDWWFARDYTVDDCIGHGGLTQYKCPCGTAGLWNSNWFSQTILIPTYVSSTCLILEETLSASQKTACLRIPHRAYDRRDNRANGVVALTGANAINVMQNSISMALLEGNDSILADAFSRTFAAVVYADKAAEDGIHRDGSFLQHKGILYNSNYGKDLVNAFLQLQGEATGTKYSAPNDTRQAFATMIKGSEWMIVIDSTGRERWDANTFGRFIAFPVADIQANADINIDIAKVSSVTADFDDDWELQEAIERLASNGSKALHGNRAFWASDYMVHKRRGVTVAAKMISKRSTNTELVNLANPLGFHLGQGTLFTYATGDEYVDAPGAWDWNLIPGTTTLLDSPKLDGKVVSVTGVKDFVGSVSDGWIGTAVEEYQQPEADSPLSYRKAWFFLYDVVVVVTTNISPSTTPVITTLDNRLATEGGLWVDGRMIHAGNGTKAKGKWMWYGGNGYTSFDVPFNLTLAEGERTGNWSAISTSTAGSTAQSIFSAYTTISSSSHAYALHPSIDTATLSDLADHPSNVPVYGDEGIMGVAGDQRLSIVFWPNSSGKITVGLDKIGWENKGSITVSSSAAAVYLFAIDDDGSTFVVTVADPTQKLSSVTLSISSSIAIHCPSNGAKMCKQTDKRVSHTFALPTGGFAGSSVSARFPIWRP